MQKKKVNKWIKVIWLMLFYWFVLAASHPLSADGNIIGAGGSLALLFIFITLFFGKNPIDIRDVLFFVLNVGFGLIFLFRYELHYIGLTLVCISLVLLVFMHFKDVESN